MTTNITPAQRDVFDALTSGRFDNFALLSCRVGGEPAAAIVSVQRDGEGTTITPLFVSVTPGVVLTDHDGASPG